MSDPIEALENRQQFSNPPAMTGDQVRGFLLRLSRAGIDGCEEAERGKVRLNSFKPNGIQDRWGHGAGLIAAAGYQE